MRRVLEWAAYLSSRLGRAGGLGAALLGAATAMQFLVVQPMLEGNRMLMAKAERLAQDARASSRTAARMEDGAEMLTPASKAPEALAQVFAAAEEAGLHLEQGEYRQAHEQASGLTQFHITLPVIGTYPEVRSFLAEAMNREPGLALDLLHLSRDGVEDTELEAQVQITLFMREGS